MQLFILTLIMLFWQCLRGEHAAVEGFIEQAGRLVRKRVYRLFEGKHGHYGRLATGQDVEEVVQSTLMRLFEDQARVLRNYDPERGPLEAYIVWIAKREAGNFLARKKALKRIGEVVTDPLEASFDCAAEDGDPERTLEAQEINRLLEEKLLRQLTDKGRLFYRLIFIEELETEQIVRLCNVSRDVVFTWRKRIRDTLSEILKEISSEPLSDERLPSVEGVKEHES